MYDLHFMKHVMMYFVFPQIKFISSKQVLITLCLMKYTYILLTTVGVDNYIVVDYKKIYKQ